MRFAAARTESRRSVTALLTAGLSCSTELTRRLPGWNRKRSCFRLSTCPCGTGCGNTLKRRARLRGSRPHILPARWETMCSSARQCHGWRIRIFHTPIPARRTMPPRFLTGGNIQKRMGGLSCRFRCRRTILL